MSNEQIFYNGQLAAQAYYRSGQAHIMGSRQMQQIQGEGGQTLSFGQQEWRVSIPKQGSMWVEKANLQIVISAITKTGGTYVRGVNALPIFMFNDIELWQGGRKLSTVYPTKIFEETYAHNDSDEIQILKPALGIDSDANRATAAAAAQTFTIEMDELFALFSQPIEYFLLREELQFRFHPISSAALLVQTDGTSPTFSITSAVLNVSYVETSPQLNKVVSDMHAKEGIPKYHYDYLELKYAIGTGQTQYPNVMQSLQNTDLVYLAFVLKLNSDLSTAGAYNYTNFQTLASWNIKSGSNYINDALFDITPTIYRQNQLDIYGFRGTANLLGQNIFAISWAHDLDEAFGENKNQFSGCKNMRGVVDATLNLTFSSAVAAAQTLFVEAVVAERLILKNGIFTKTQ